MAATLPQHVAIIMDGNRRWAKRKGVSTFRGHSEGIERSKELVEECLQLAIPYLTVWAFSTENWKRSKREVHYLMCLFERYFSEYAAEFQEKGIRFVHLGRKDRLPKSLARLLLKTETDTQSNRKLTLSLAIDYGGRDEILRAMQKISQKGGCSEKSFGVLLDTACLPDPDLIIRTSGEMRLSGFLLWQCAYSELYFTKKCFPEFTKMEFKKALKDFSVRRRNFGK
jgi:undecaprenyl diphosphate synthase